MLTFEGEGLSTLWIEVEVTGVVMQILCGVDKVLGVVCFSEGVCNEIGSSV